MLIETTLGLMDPSELERREGSNETDDEIASWVEYWHDGVLVHRSAHVHLKRLPNWELAPILQLIAG